MMKTKLNVYQFMFMFPKLQSRNSSAKGGYLRLPQIMLCNISKKKMGLQKTFSSRWSKIPTFSAKHIVIRGLPQA